MSLVADLQEWYKSNSYPPDGPELDETYDADEDTWVEKGTDTEQVSWEVVDTSGRWGNRIEVVYKRGDELVAVYDMEPATEMQDWGDYGAPEIVEVEEIKVTVTKYQRKTDY